MTNEKLPFEIHGNSDIIQNKNPICITFGNFDGVHLGHKYLIESMQSMLDNIPIVVVTFDPHSADFFTPHNPKLLLTNLENKISLLLSYGVSAVIVQKFNQEFASLTADNFCDTWLNSNFNINSVILGHDFCYGKNRQGNFLHMKDYGEKHGWNVLQINPFKNSITNLKPISSTFIRDEISLGHMENAEILLGRPYLLSGIVAHGDQRGRAIGFPTANLKLDCNYALPKYGVYACYVEISPNELLPAVMNCGIRPSVGEGLKLQIEAHILNFNEDIYDKKIKFHLKKYLRGEKKFAHIDELKQQISVDVDEAKKYFSP